MRLPEIHCRNYTENAQRNNPFLKGNAMKHTLYGKAELFVFASREEMGRRAASDAADCLRTLLAARKEVNVIFASAPSQNELLAALVAEPSIAWDRVNAFHMDEYVGLPHGDSRLFSSYLTKTIFGKLPFKTVNLMNGQSDAREECSRYSSLLRECPPDIVCMGIGENGHIAFNDPSVADFEDTELVKPVMLEESCRRQQVNDGCFATLADVPTTAITMTIPVLIQAKNMFCVVPGARKADALRAAMTGPESESCPASIMRRHEGARIYADTDAGGEL